MNSPPPPPFHPFYSPYSSAYDIHSVGSQSSFDRYSSTNGSDRYTDVPLYRTQTLPPKIETRRPEFSKSESFGGRSSVAVDSSGSSAMESTTGKDFLYFKYTKRGARWDEEPIIEEIPASQAEMKKKVDKRRSRHSAIVHLAKMGSYRRAQVDQHIKLLNAEEVDGSLWEPVYIDNSIVMYKGTTMEVKSFEVIFARSQSKRRMSMGPVPTRPPYHQSAEPKAESKAEKPKEKKKPKDKKTEKAPNFGVVDDPFHATEWFDGFGSALGGQGAGATLPTRLPQDKPIGTPLPPRIIPGLNPEDEYPTAPPPLPGAGLFGAFGAADQEPLKYEIPTRQGVRGGEGIVRVSDEEGDKRNYKHESKDRGRRHRHTPSASPRPRSVSRSRNVRFSTDSGIILPMSDNSSVSSADIGVIFDEVEELSSYTSEDTRGSPSGQKIYRVVSSANRQHRPGPTQTQSPRRYHFASDEKVVMPERALRKSERTALEQTQAQAQAAYGVEQKMVRRPTLKPIITQSAPPSPLVFDVPPIAVYPSHFEEQEHKQRVHEQELRADDYMRQKTRERSVQEREAELAQRDRDVMNHAKREEERRQREMVELREELQNTRLDREFGARRKVYTHEPRDKYTGFNR